MITCAFEDGNQALLRHVVVDTIVCKDDQILLVKRTGKLLEGGKWGLVGGFVERDETIAQAVAREVHEETGWQIKELTLLRIKDDPNRPKEDRQNVAFVYFCTATEKTGEPDWESDDQQWFAWDKIPDDEAMAFDHAEEIALYRQYQRGGMAIPIVG